MRRGAAAPALAGAALLALGGCASTHVAQSGKTSGAQPTMKAAPRGCTAAEVAADDPRFTDDPSGNRDSYTASFDFFPSSVCTVAAYPALRFLRGGRVLPFGAQPVDPSDTTVTTLTPGRSYQMNVDITGGFLGGSDVCKNPVTADTIIITFAPGSKGNTVHNTRTNTTGALLSAGLVFCANSMAYQREID